MITPRLKNRIADVIKYAISLNEFSRILDTDFNFKLKHDKTNIKLSISAKLNGFYDVEVFNTKVIDRQVISDADSVVAYVSQVYLPILIEWSEPSIWESIGSSKNNGFTEEKFNTSEIEILKPLISDFKNSLIEINKEIANLHLVVGKLNDLTENIGKTGKFDWSNQILGLVLNLIITGLIPSEFQGSIFRMLMSIFEKANVYRLN